MITRVYIDNFRCFSNFEWEPGRLSLLLGENGSGKSSIHEVIAYIVAFVGGYSDANVFRIIDNRCAWDQRTDQAFELEIAQAGDRFRYRLILRAGVEVAIVSETLHFNDRLIYDQELGGIVLYDDNGVESGTLRINSPRSLIGMLSIGATTGGMQKFAAILARILIFRPNPLAMKAVTERDVRVPSVDLSDLVGWLVSLGANRADFSYRLLQDLKEALPGFQMYHLLEVGVTARAMQLSFRAGENAGKDAEFSLYLDQLSHGQKMLVAIYTILHGLIGESAIVLIDEPDNYLSSREVQPWLRALEERLQEGSGQVLLISHHPEALDYLVPDHGFQFYREHNGPVRVKRLAWNDDDALKPSEAAARGWLE